MKTKSPESQLSDIIAYYKCQNFDSARLMFGKLSPNQVIDLQAINSSDDDLIVMLWALEPHWAYEVTYALHTRGIDNWLEPEKMPPPEQLHPDRPLAKCTDYTPHYYQWLAEQSELKRLATEAKQYMPVDLDAEIARCDEAISTILEVVKDAGVIDEMKAHFLGRVAEWRNHRAELVAAKGGAL